MTIDSEIDEPPPQSKPCNWFLWQRILCFVCGTILPLVCFAMVFESPPVKPKWQSGDLSAYVKLMLGGRPTYPMFPLLLFPMVSLSLLMSSFDRFVRWAWVRMGVYSGVFLAAHYVIMFWLALGMLDSVEGVLRAIGWLFGCGVAIGILKLLAWLHRRFSTKLFGKGIATLLAIGYVLCVVFYEEDRLAKRLVSPIMILFYLSLFYGPCILMVTYVSLSWRIIRFQKKEAFRYSLLQIFATTTWLASYLSLVRWSIALAMVEYAKLPVDRRNCYIATAASQGHPWFVRSYEIQCGDGTKRRVNNQLRHFKLAEIALIVTMPQAHRWLRRIYDLLGPKIAFLVHLPLLADITYVVLKPAEFVALLILRIAAPDHRSINLYEKSTLDPKNTQESTSS